MFRLTLSSICVLACTLAFANSASSFVIQETDGPERWNNSLTFDFEYNNLLSSNHEPKHSHIFALSVGLDMPLRYPPPDFKYFEGVHLQLNWFNENYEGPGEHDVASIQLGYELRIFESDQCNDDDDDDDGVESREENPEQEPAKARARRFVPRHGDVGLRAWGEIGVASVKSYAKYTSESAPRVGVGVEFYGHHIGIRYSWATEMYDQPMKEHWLRLVPKLAKTGMEVAIGVRFLESDAYSATQLTLGLAWRY